MSHMMQTLQRSIIKQENHQQQQQHHQHSQNNANIFFFILLFVLFHTKKRNQLLKKYVSIFIQKLSVSQAAKSTHNLKDTKREGADVQSVSISGF